MITGYNDIVRLRLDNGVELRCTPSHKIFTTNRGYVEARQLALRRRGQAARSRGAGGRRRPGAAGVLGSGGLLDQGGPRAAAAVPRHRGRRSSRTTSAGSIGDGSTSGTTVATIYGSEEDRDEILPRHAELLDWVNCERPIKLSEQANGTVQLRLARRAFKRFIEALGVKLGQGAGEDACRGRSSRRRPRWWRRSCAGCSTPMGAWWIAGKNRYVGLGSTSPELLRGVQTLLSTFGIMSRIYQTKRGVDGGVVHLHQQGRRDEAATASSAAYDLRITSDRSCASPSTSASRFSRKAALLRSARGRRPEGSVLGPDHGAPARAHQRRRRADLQPHRASQPLVRGQWGRCTQLLASTCTSTTQPAIWRRMNLLTFLDENDEFDVEGFKAGGVGRVHRAGDHRRQRRLPDREDRRDDARLPPARHRLRQPGRAAHGPGPALRLRRRAGLGGRHHGAADRARLRHLGPHRGPHGPLRRLPRERRADAQRAAHAPGRGGPHRRGRRAARAALGGPGVLGPGGRPGRGLRRAQLAGLGAGADWDHRPADGLRHHRRRARPRSGQDQEAGRRRHHVDRQPDGAPGPGQAGLRRRSRPRTSWPTSTSTCRSSARPTSPPSTCRSSPAPWATTPSTTRATSA